jgi:phosphoribosylanthranilate isomerase
MTWIKICGITNLEDALAAVDSGADAVGFVFYEKSPRRVDASAAREIVAQLPERIEKIGVFVDLAQEQLAEIVNEVGLTGVQCRLRPPAAGAAPDGRTKYKNPVRMILPLSVTQLLQDEKRLQGLTAEFVRLSESRRPSAAFDTFLLDSTTPERPGGTGKTFDWQKVVPLVQVMNKSVKVIAAGGLTPDNVGKAMRTLHPWGVDVASGVEAGPGRKDPDKVRAFICAVREADKA